MRVVVLRSLRAQRCDRLALPPLAIGASFAHELEALS